MMTDFKLPDVETVRDYSDNEILEELGWWTDGLRGIPGNTRDNCKPAPNAPDLREWPDAFRCAPALYWSLLAEAKRRRLV